MALSNVRAYYKRKYYANGEWKIEDEYECSQLNSTVEYPNGYYQAYMENNLLDGGLTSLYISNFGEACYASYQPGKIFLGKKYYKINDFFSESSLTALRQDLETAVDFLFKNASEPTYYANFLPRYNEIFWQNNEGLNIIPYYDISYSYASNYRTLGVNFELRYMITKLNPSDIILKLSTDPTKTMYKIDEKTGEEVPLSWSGSDKDIITTGILSTTRLNPKVNYVYELPKSTDEILGYYDSYILELKKVKFYILYSNNGESISPVQRDNIWYYTKRVNIANKNEFIFLCDISNISSFPTSGFYILGQNPPTNFLSRITTNGGPDANDPDETDDPYDDDPNTGDDDDEGGDGDFDDTDDIIDKPVPPTLSATGVGLIHAYNPSSSQLESIASKLWSPNYLEAFTQYFTSPMEAILGLSIIPVKPSIGASENVYLGKYDTEVSVPKIESDYVTINCGSIPINRYWGSYLDYDPYTKISCYLPYIGEIDINPDQVMQKTVGLIYQVNVITGDIIAALTANGSVFATAAGNCIRQLPISQTDYSNIINTAVNAVGSLTMAVATAGLGSALSNASTGAMAEVASARASANNTRSAFSLVDNIMNSKFHYLHAGSIGTGSGQLTVQKAFLTIERPNLDLANNYKSYVGYPCNKTLQLGRCHGFTKIESIKLIIPTATDEEIAEIIAILTEGVIL